MDERWAIDVLSGRRRDFGARLLRLGCRLAAIPYGWAMQLRNLAYNRDWLQVVAVDVPVISVGNLTTGGTGKTPVVAWLVQDLQRRGYRPGILSRGYRQLESGRNDEALVLERLCPGVPHVQNRDRVQGARQAVEQHGCNVLVLDDGYQHRRLHRDLDLVLIDAQQPWGYGHLLPRGLLREPLAQLWRADVAVITRADAAARIATVPAIQQTLRQYRGQEDAVCVEFQAGQWLSACGETRSLKSLVEESAAVFCGIGNPDAFFSSVRPLATVKAERAFADHHHYTEADLAELENWRTAHGATVLLTTLKDLVKIPAGHPLADRVLALNIGCQVTADGGLLERALDRVAPPLRSESRAA